MKVSCSKGSEKIRVHKRGGGGSGKKVGKGGAKKTWEGITVEDRGEYTRICIAAD